MKEGGNMAIGNNKLNNKGMAISGILYSILVLFIVYIAENIPT